MLYEFPVDQAPKEIQSWLWPKNQLLICSRAAFPALAALDSPLASIISAPLFWTFGISVPSYHYLPIKSIAGFPLTWAQVRSGNIVGEWFPQITTLAISATADPVLSATCQTALSWSNLVIAQKFYLGKSFAWVAAIKQLVLAGFPTVKTLTSLWAWSFKAFPWGMKILAFSWSKSPLYIPLLLGFAPTNNAA
jgi:hypothetical protein